jgi:signal transduction histidine kinase
MYIFAYIYILSTVHPFDESVCAHLVSDKHWITENMLCLLSNAIKYGDKGHVDVHVEVVDAPVCEHENSSSLSAKGIEVRAVEHLKSSTRDFNADITAYRSKSVSLGSRGKKGQDKNSVSLKKKRMVLVTVEDLGIGICEEARKNLFQPFKQAQRMAGGTGLGLYSLLKRVEALGGEVLITSCFFYPKLGFILVIESHSSSILNLFLCNTLSIPLFQTLPLTPTLPFTLFLNPYP